MPVLIKADDEILWECLIMNSDPDSDGEDDYALIRTGTKPSLTLSRLA